MSRTAPRLWSVLAALAVLLATAFATTVAPAQAAYPGREGRIVFVRQNQIYSIRPDGRDLRQLTTGAKNYRPHWSPNGARIAYVREAGGTRNLWVMNANGSGKQQVTNLGQVTGATWSPDGTQLVFGGGAGGLTLMTVSSTAPFGAPAQVLVDRGRGDPPEPQSVNPGSAPAWSPDGTMIAFYTDDYPSSPDHFMVAIDVASGTYLWDRGIGGACCGYGTFADPAFSPSNVLGFTELAAGGPTTLQDWGVDRLADPTVPLITNSVDGDQQLAWSPSGGRIAFVNDANGTSRIFLAKFDGTNRKALTVGYQPDWQPLP